MAVLTAEGRSRRKSLPPGASPEVQQRVPCSIPPTLPAWRRRDDIPSRSSSRTPSTPIAEAVREPAAATCLRPCLHGIWSGGSNGLRRTSQKTPRKAFAEGQERFLLRHDSVCDPSYRNFSSCLFLRRRPVVRPCRSPTSGRSGKRGRLIFLPTWILGAHEFGDERVMIGGDAGQGSPMDIQAERSQCHVDEDMVESEQWENCRVSAK